MKKLVALILALVAIVSVNSAAFAVTIVNNDGTTNEGVLTEDAIFLLDDFGRICGLSSAKENNNLVEYHENAEVVGGVLGNGKIVRRKAMHELTVDAAGQVAIGGSTIAASWQVFEQEVCSELGLTGAASVVDATIQATPNGTLALNGIEVPVYAGYHRFLTSDKGQEIGHLSVWIDGQRFAISVRYADWDGDGDMEVCFRAGAYESVKSSTSTPSAPTNPAKPSGSNEPNPENDDIVLPW